MLSYIFSLPFLLPYPDVCPWILFFSCVKGANKILLCTVAETEASLFSLSLSHIFSLTLFTTFGTKSGNIKAKEKKPSHGIWATSQTLFALKKTSLGKLGCCRQNSTENWIFWHFILIKQMLLYLTSYFYFCKLDIISNCVILNSRDDGTWVYFLFYLTTLWNDVSFYAVHSLRKRDRFRSTLFATKLFLFPNISWVPARKKGRKD